MDSQDLSSRHIELLSPLTLSSSQAGSFTTQSTSVDSQSHNEFEIHPEENSQRKKRTVTFAEIDVSELDYHATKIPMEEKRRWKTQAIERKKAKKNWQRRMKKRLLKGSIISLFLILCSLVGILAVAQRTHTKL
ncbi:hypothetical protein CAEBREN_25535 [Caenorhabditis brenneri]|uniref:Uncharacterized protein n=1 Tax=Caenorhabditis brenneri TaxID=135651 RepID=G0N7K1_CAEBE|nr:hypothetical protein CAEBREN_25535 [Caenorhabditis brenneri]